MGSAPRWTEKAYGPQRALCLSSRLFVLLRDELGLGRQPKIARLLVNEILAVVEDTRVTAEQMQPGQLLVLAPEVGQGPSWSQGKLEDKRLKAIRLSLIEPDDIESLAAGENPFVVRRRRLVRLIRQAYEQGATLSTCQLDVITGFSFCTITLSMRANEFSAPIPTNPAFRPYVKPSGSVRGADPRHLPGSAAQSSSTRPWPDVVCDQAQSFR